MNRELFRTVYRSVRAHRTVASERNWPPFLGTQRIAGVEIRPGNCFRAGKAGERNRRFWIASAMIADWRRVQHGPHAYDRRMLGIATRRNIDFMRSARFWTGSLLP